MRLVAGDEAGAHPHANAAKGQRSGKATAIVKPARGHHRDIDGVHALRPERDRSDTASVAAAFGALRDDHVAAGFGGFHRVLHVAGHAHHHDAGLLQFGDDRHRHAQPGDEGLGASLDDHVHTGGQRFGLGGEQIDAERFVGQVLHARHLIGDELGRQARHAQRAKTAGVGNRRADFSIGHAAHAGEQDGVIDTKQITDDSAQSHGFRDLQ